MNRLKNYFGRFFNFMSIECERSVEQKSTEEKMKTIKVNNPNDLPENYTGICEYPSGNIHYYLNGLLHREDGPAIIFSHGTLEYFLNGEIHREDGPAIIFSHGRLDYYLNGKRHREDGPAIIYSSGLGYYYINDDTITEEVNKWIKNNNILDYRFWNESDKKLFRKTFCYNVTKLERSVEYQAES